MINIAGLTPVDDPSYRYKMPRVIPKVEGRGNGIKTVIVNVAEIATALNRDASEITKFFGCELGAQTTMSVADDRYVVNGAHSLSDLEKFMAKYIENFVLCKQCRLPETHYKIKNQMINQKCMACGSKDMCDMTHKLTTFILKNFKKPSEKDKKDKKKEKKDKKKEKKSKDDDDEDADEDADEDEKKEKKKDKKEKKEKKEKKDKKKKKEKKEDVASDNSDSEEDTDSDATNAAIEMFRLWSLNSSTPETVFSKVTPAVVAEELRSIQNLSSLRPSDRAIIFMGATFTPTSIADHDIAKHKDVLAAIAPTDLMQRHLIAACEWFCGVHVPEVQRMFPVMLKQLFDEDLVEEDVFYSWHTDYARNEFSAEASLISTDTLEALKESAQPFITWLQEADEEGDSDESDEEEDDEEED